MQLAGREPEEAGRRPEEAVCTNATRRAEARHAVCTNATRREPDMPCAKTQLAGRTGRKTVMAIRVKPI